MTATGYESWLAEQAAQRDMNNTARALRIRAIDVDLLDLASNDYLNLANDQRIINGATAAAIAWGAGATGSRLVTGSTALHRQLELAFADFMGTESALVFSSGYLANLGAITALTDRETTIISDAENHASLIDAIRLSRATSIVVDHASLAAVEQALVERHTKRAMVVTDAVFSVDGDLAPLRELHELCVAHSALLVVDEAHSLGVIGDLGQGACVQAGIADSPVVVMTATASKSLGTQGGAVLANAAVIDHIMNTARSFIFDTALAPACVGAALAALAVLVAEPERCQEVRAHACTLQQIGRDHGLVSNQTDSAVTSLQLPSAAAAVELATHCWDQGIAVGCFRPPSVPDGISRLRLTAHAELTSADFERFTHALHSRT